MNEFALEKGAVNNIFLIFLQISRYSPTSSMGGIRVPAPPPHAIAWLSGARDSHTTALSISTSAVLTFSFSVA